jgi:hypothetical protein
MQSEKKTDITHLFHLAVDWYSVNPGKQIPLDLWDANADEYGNMADEWVITVGNRIIKNIQTTVIPVLAAINLGYSSEQVLAVIKHHGMDSIDFLGCSYLRLLQQKERTLPGSDKPYVLDPWSINREIVNAMSLDAELSSDLAGQFIGYENTYGTNFEFEIAGLLSSNESLWPITNLESFLKERKAGILDQETPVPRRTPIYAFINSGIDFDQISLDQILLILKRSGSLHPEAISENGFGSGSFSNFFKELFLELDNKAVDGLSRLMEALNSVNNPDVLKEIQDSILRTLPDFEDATVSDGLSIMRMMNLHLNEELYTEVFESMVIKTNIMPTADIPKVLNDPYFGTIIPALNEFREFEDTIFRRLYNEVNYLDPSDFRRPHFTALGSVAKDWKVQQNLTGIDLQGFLIKVLSALDSYKAATHYDDEGQVTDSFAHHASQQVCQLSSFVASNINADYQRFADLPSHQKALLAANGFDIRKLPGINRKDKGQVLSEEMGL